MRPMRGLASLEVLLRAEGVMRHDWVFDVLSDLLAYATQNNLPRLAARVAAAITEAQAEIATVDGPDEPPQSPPPSGRHMH